MTKSTVRAAVAGLNRSRFPRLAAPLAGRGALPRDTSVNAAPHASQARPLNGHRQISEKMGAQLLVAGSPGSSTTFVTITPASSALTFALSALAGSTTYATSRIFIASTPTTRNRRMFSTMSGGGEGALRAGRTGNAPRTGVRCTGLSPLRSARPARRSAIPNVTPTNARITPPRMVITALSPSTSVSAARPCRLRRRPLRALWCRGPIRSRCSSVPGPRR